MDTKIEAVKLFLTPQTVENVHSFLGFAGCYRAFVCNFASINSQEGRPLHLGGCSTTHVIVFPDYTLPFTLCTDTLALGVRDVLMQSFEGQRPHLIAYASRELNTAEFKYSVTHMEALAIVWPLKHLRDITYGYPVTDLSAVTQLFSAKNLTRRLARWYLNVQKFEPTIKYLPSMANVIADALTHNIPVSVVTSILIFLCLSSVRPNTKTQSGFISYMHLSLVTTLFCLSFLYLLLTFL